jgi:hypothetical protein
LVGALLSASFWLPSFIEENLTQYPLSYFGTNAYKTNLLSVFQLLGFWHIPWGFRPPVLGLCLSIGLIVVVIGLVVLRRKNYLLLGCIAACFASLFLASSLSVFAWNSLGILKMLQFPWRFLAGATIAAIFAICLFVDSLPKRFAIGIAFCLLILALFNLPYFYPSNYNYIAVYTADDACSTTTWANEYLPKWTNVCLPKPKTKSFPNVILLNKNVAVSFLEVNNYGRSISFYSEASRSAQVLIRRYYFPAWQVSIDQKSVKAGPYGKEGLISVNIPMGKHRISALWRGTFIENISNWISIVTVFFILLFFVNKKIRKLL